MIIERSTSPEWLSNTYLIADRRGGAGILIDTGGPPEPILRKVGDLGVTVTHALCTHHHVDHVAHSDLYRARLGCLICGHARERRLFPRLDLGFTEGQVFAAGALTVRCLDIPGHTLGQTAFVVEDRAVFTGDTLFRGSVGGTRAPGHTTFADLRRSIMDVLMKLPHGMAVHPGHAEATTIGHEWDQNPFIRIWRGLDPPGAERCVAGGRPATLVLRARDYDGGTKCWVRFDRDGRDDVLPGSIVRDAEAR